jgi:DNA-directed RNA polymerase subunit alpha
MEKHIKNIRICPEWKCVDDDQENNSRLHYSRFALSPLLVDQAMTIGVAMRRALLSEVESISITSVRIVGGLHEYSSLEGVRESIDEILINLKQIVLKGDVTIEEHASIFAQGPGVVTAGHINFPTSIQVVDPNQYIATLSKNVQLCIELRINQGKGNQVKNHINNEDGFFNISPRFTPVQKVNFSIYSLGEEKDRQQLLLLEVWTNKTLTPEEALYQAHNSLLNLFYTIAPPIPSKHVSKLENTDPKEEKNKVRSSTGIHLSDKPGHVLHASIENALSIDQKLENLTNRNNVSIDELELSPRIYNCLKKANIHTVSDLVSYTPENLLKIKNFGRKSVEQVILVLKKRFGLQLGTIKK